MEWDEYIGGLLNQRCAFDNVHISMNGEAQPSSIPPIIKASMLMLDRMQAAKSNHNVLIFPEKSQSVFLFVLTRLLHGIGEGQIKISYNPDSFQPGEKLKFENCIVRFEGIDVSNGIHRIKFTLAAGLTISALIENMPLFQRTNTQKPLSTNDQYNDAKRKLKERFIEFGRGDGLLERLAKNITHLNSSVFYVAPVGNAKEQLFSCLLNGHEADEILLVGQANFKGEIESIIPGQLAGVPSIVLASDLNAAAAAIENGAPIHSLVFDISNNNAMNKQLNVLDDLMRRQIPIICLTDAANSFELQALTIRGFSIWRWDEDCLTDGLFRGSHFHIDRKARNCARRKVEYILSEYAQLSDSLRMLIAHRSEVLEQSPKMIALDVQLKSATFKALRAITPLTPAERLRFEQALAERRKVLEKEKGFLPNNFYQDYCMVVDNLITVYSSTTTLPKTMALKEYLKAKQYSCVVFVVSNNTDKHMVQEFWETWCIASALETEIVVFTPSEYQTQNLPHHAVTIISGWLSGETMRSILYGFNSESYAVFLYDYEQRWKNTQTTVWSKVLSRSDNRKIVRTALTTGSLDISISRFRDEAASVEAETPGADELNDIELVIHDSKYKQYSILEGQHTADDTVEAIPVNFIGDWLAFFRPAHEVITATGIITKKEDKIRIKKSEKLEVGDFIVVREADRDLIRELADVILANSGKQRRRELATKWKEPFRIEAGLANSVEHIYKKLKEVGCTATYATVRTWIKDENMICPEKKETLVYIARALDDVVIMDMVDEIYEAARDVWKAHAQAGQHLSEQLRRKISSALHEYGEIDPFNIQEPISLQLEHIGMVKILKIIDINPSMVVDIANTNRLLAD